MPQGHNLIDPATGANAVRSSVKFSKEPTRIIDTSQWDPSNKSAKKYDGCLLWFWKFMD